MSPVLARREFLKAGLATGLAAVAAAAPTSRAGTNAAKRRFTMDLNCGSIGVRADQREAITLAHAHGFESVGADADFLSRLSDTELQDLLSDLKAKSLVWGAAGLPVEFRSDEAAFRKGLEALPKQARGLQRAGVTRVGTWLRPSHAELTYTANFRQHADRLREVATILGDHGLRFGLEYVAPKTSWTSARHPFVHTLAETRELIAAIHRDNVGIVLDSWHWYNAGETAKDIEGLSNRDVVACDLNDAPAGIPVEEQKDLVRALPCATGVIDLKAFLSALVAIEYDGPVRAEPFDAELRKLPAEQAVERTARAMKQAFALVG